MISHGSQIITDLRRGTWRITSMTRGSFDILGLFTSPYSTAATAALKAAFSTAQWETIRDYGWQHPEIVGYMNAYAPEDPKIAYSLVPTLGKIRLLNNGGTAYALTDLIPPSVDMYTDCEFIFNSFPSTGFIVGTVNSSSWNGYSLLHYNGANMYMNWAGNDISLGYASVAGTLYSMQADRGKVTVNGVDKSTQRSGSYTYQYPIALFARNVGGSVSGPVNMQGSKFIFKASVNGEMLRHYVPFKKDGQFEWLDLLSGRLAARTGSFTEVLIESPA